MGTMWRVQFDYFFSCHIIKIKKTCTTKNKFLFIVSFLCIHISQPLSISQFKCLKGHGHSLAPLKQVTYTYNQYYVPFSGFLSYKPSTRKVPFLAPPTVTMHLSICTFETANDMSHKFSNAARKQREKKTVISTTRGVKNRANKPKL